MEKMEKIKSNEGTAGYDPLTTIEVEGNESEALNWYISKN